MAEIDTSDSVLLDELLAKAEPGTTPEQVVLLRARAAKVNVFAACGIVAGMKLPRRENGHG